MRWLVLSDIHGNWEALEAILEHAAGRYDQILNCGDLVGYGPDPNAVTEWCRNNTPLVVRGNHDKACVGLLDLEWFNKVARASAEWTMAALTEENRAYLYALPQGPREVEGFQILHGSPEDEDEYIVNLDDAERIESQLDHALSFFGHTHLQGGFWIRRNGVRRISTPAVNIEETAFYLINPGSVGQPRDGNPNAAYAIYLPEERHVEYHRVAYDVPRVQQKIVNAGLPEILAYRLMIGS